MPSERVLVVGAGIAGLSCAIALGRHGYPVDVVERSGEVEPVPINLTGRSVDALADLGVLAECMVQANARTKPVFGNIFDAAGRRREIDRPQEPHSLLPKSVAMFRPALMDVLRTAARDAGAAYRQPRAVQSIMQFSETALVSFDDGSTGEYDLVIGADGLRSTVRSLIWGDEITPAYTGALGLRWVVTDDLPAGNEGFYYAPSQVVVIGRLPGNRTYGATFAITDNVDPTQDEARELLLGVLDAYTAPFLTTVRERIDDRSRIHTRPWEWIWLPKWAEGRVVLVGDAAHATAPYVPAGGGMAVIDGVVLGEELAEADDLAEGIAAFVHRRQDRARLVVETSVEVTRLQQQGDRLTSSKVLKDALRLLSLPY